ncbi:MAG: DUF5678 domain-containing protein [Nanoarchaeota archaeon]
MKRISKEFWEDQQWGFQHHTDLLLQFKDQWVAIFNKRIICSGTDLGEVEQEAKKKTGKEEVPVIFVECGAHLY